VQIRPFGACARGPVQRIVLGGAPRPELHLLDLGATVHALHVECGDGQRRNVVLGHPQAQDHLDHVFYVGGSVGRYANRIAGGRFPLDGHEVEVTTNDRGHHLHGGPDGFDRRIWEVVDADADSVVLRLHSPDGDQGFPGNLEVRATFAVLDDGVRVGYAATTDAPTPVNLTSHAYFNLDGEGSGSARQHLLQVAAEEYLPVDGTGIPLGGPTSVAGTPFDFREPVAIDSRPGVDHTFAVPGEGRRRMASLESPRSRTRLTVYADPPGLQVYTGNFLDGTVPGTSGGVYRQGDGIALEPQLFPDTPNRPELGSSILRPGETYAAVIEWRFETTDARGSGSG
jgi:aldose 1-epimerase